MTLLEKPWRMAKSDVPLEASPTLGQHTDEVLAAELSLTPTDLEALRERHVIV